MRELERADVPRAHDVRPRAEVDEIAVLEIGNRLAFGNVLDNIELELARHGPFAQRGQPAFLGVLQRLGARHDHLFKRLVRLDHPLHFLLDLGKILWRDAMRHFHVVIKAVLNRRSGGELGVGPELGDGGGQDMRAGVAEALQFRHLVAIIQRFSFVIHNVNLLLHWPSSTSSLVCPFHSTTTRSDSIPATRTPLTVSPSPTVFPLIKARGAVLL